MVLLLAALLVQGTIDAVAGDVAVHVFVRLAHAEHRSDALAHPPGRLLAGVPDGEQDERTCRGLIRSNTHVGENRIGVLLERLQPRDDLSQILLVSGIVGIPVTGYAMDTLGPYGLLIVVGGVFSVATLAFVANVFTARHPQGTRPR